MPERHKETGHKVTEEGHKWHDATEWHEALKRLEATEWHEALKLLEAITQIESRPVKRFQ